MDSGEGQASLIDYAQLFAAIHDLYSALLTFVRAEYFISRWLNGRQTELAVEDGLTVSAITKNSPETVTGTGIAVGLKAVGDALSIGKQYVEIRTANLKVQEAQMEFKHKQDVYEREERRARLKEKTLEAEFDLELERKRQEVEAGRQHLRENELNLKKVEQESALRTVQVLGEYVKLFKEMPESFREEFKNDVLIPITRRIVASPLTLSSYSVEPLDNTGQEASDKPPAASDEIL